MWGGEYKVGGNLEDRIGEGAAKENVLTRAGKVFT